MFSPAASILARALWLGLYLDPKRERFAAVATHESDDGVSPAVLLRHLAMDCLQLRRFLH